MTEEHARLKVMLTLLIHDTVIWTKSTAEEDFQGADSVALWDRVDEQRERIVKEFGYSKDIANAAMALITDLRQELNVQPHETLSSAVAALNRPKA